MEGEFADGKGGLFMDNVNLKSFHDLASIADPCQQARALRLEVVRSLRGVLRRRWMNPVTPQMGVPGLQTGHRGPWPRPIRLHVPAGKP